MTYTIDGSTTMVLADIGDTFTTDPMLIFTRDGKEVPIAAVIPFIQAIDIAENTITDGYDAELTDNHGQSATFFFPTLEDIASYILSMTHMGPAEVTVEPAQAVPDAETSPTPEAAPEAAVASCGARHRATGKASVPCLFADCFSGYVIRDSDEVLAQLYSLDDVRAWADEHPEAYFGDLSVSVWWADMHYPAGNFYRICLVIRWNGEDLAYAHTDDHFHHVLENMAAMGHVLHPLPKDQRAAPTLEFCAGCIDVTDGYLSGRSITKVAIQAARAARAVIRNVDKALSLQVAGDVAGFDALVKVIPAQADKMLLDVVGYMDLTLFDDINHRSFEAASSRSDPRYWGYIAGEYIKWSEQQLSAAAS